MKRIRTVAAVLAIATTGAVLQAIGALAEVPAGRRVVVLPRVEVVAAVPGERPARLPQMQRGTRSKSG